MDYGRFLDAETLRFERVMPATAQTLWEHLTSSEWLGGWLMPGAIQPGVGGEVTFMSPFTEGKVQCRGVVTAWEPHRRLAYTWRESSTESQVSFELTPVEDGVRLVLIHARMPASDATGFAHGWHSCFNALERQLRGAPDEAIKAAWNGEGVDVARYNAEGAALGLPASSGEA